MLKLNLPEYDYLIKNKNDKLLIFDLVRKKYVALTPEEWVRQHFLNYLLNYLDVPKNLVSVEGGLKYNRLSKRSDILVFSLSGNPLLLVECKAPTQVIDNTVIFQLGTYNSKIQAPFLASTNGLMHLYWRYFR
jgi:hypothetical protein